MQLDAGLGTKFNCCTFNRTAADRGTLFTQSRNNLLAGKGTTGLVLERGACSPKGNLLTKQAGGGSQLLHFPGNPLAPDGLQVNIQFLNQPL